MRVSMLLRNPFTHDTRVEKEARSLTEAGYSVTVVAEWHADLPRGEERDGYRIVRVARGPARRIGARLVQYRHRLMRALRQTRPEIIHAHDADALEPAAAVARRLRVPYVYDAHELWTEQVNRNNPELYFQLSRLYYREVERWLAPRAAAVLTVSAPIARELERRYRLRGVRLVPNYPEIPPQVAPRSIRDLVAASGKPIPDDARIVLFLGGIQIDRGVDRLLRALVDVPEAAGVFLGSGPPPPDLASLTAELGLEHRVRFLPPVPSADVVAFTASADVGVTLTQPSSLNGRYALPNKLFQYMAAGIPVVASDYEQVREIVLGSRAGLTADPRDPAAISRALRAILGDAAEARAMGERGRAAIERRYNWSESARALTDVYREVAERARLTAAR